MHTESVVRFADAVVDIAPGGRVLVLGCDPEVAHRLDAAVQAAQRQKGREDWLQFLPELYVRSVEESAHPTPDLDHAAKAQREFLGIATPTDRSLHERGRAMGKTKNRPSTAS